MEYFYKILENWKKKKIYQNLSNIMYLRVKNLKEIFLENFDETFDKIFGKFEEFAGTFENILGERSDPFISL